MTEKKTQDAYDVLVVGSGASGGWAAKRLTEKGARVALVDAGRPQSITSFNEHEPGFRLPYRDQSHELIKRTRPTQKDCYACMEWNYDWFCNDLEEPYSTAEDKPFSWQGRMRVTGGRTNVWGRQSYRLSDLDFKAASFDGYGEDWPLAYADLAPYYDIVEDYVGMSGQAEGVYELPDGRFQPPMAMTCSEVALRKRVKSALGPDDHDRPHGEPHQGHQRARRLPLLRPVRARLRHALVLQLRLDDRPRRDRDRALHARPERDGLQGAGRSRHGPRDGAPLHRPRHARAQGDPRPRRGAVRAGARVGPHPAELGEPPAPAGPRQLERRPRPLPDGPPDGRRRVGRLRAGGGQALARHSESTERHLRDPLPQHQGRRARQALPARLRHAGRRRLRLQLEGGGLRRPPTRRRCSSR